MEPNKVLQQILQSNSVTEVFNESFNNVLSRTVGDALDEVLNFHNMVFYSTKQWLLLTPENLAMLSEVIFSSENIRDYVFDVYTTATFKLGNNQEVLIDLIRTIASASISPVNSSTMTVDYVPQQLKKHTLSASEIQAVLNRNSWVIVLIMIFHVGARTNNAEVPT